MSPATPATKINPYYLPEPKGCGGKVSCPYRNKPSTMKPEDFGPTDIAIGFNDTICVVCGRGFSNPIPDPPEKPKEEGEPRRSPLGAYLLGAAILIGLAVWWFSRTKVCPKGEVAAGDTCVNYQLHQKLCDGNGGFTVGKSLKQACGNKPVPPCSKGEIIGDTIISRKKFRKVCDGNGGVTVVPVPIEDDDKPTPPAPFVPGRPYVVNRDGKCRLEKYNAEGGLEYQLTLEPGDPRCKGARKAKVLR
ncbi:hypothetical protein Slin_6484 [Spirosoma linguale DSM 74]|uniref:Uncharacterized protein n=2 Tax=Spirosoma TaxID=107 RepID=D2QUF9_SPILD|nr:hypothetical protein Slin_6484 [Spirosoma linguale DSM 74]